jgi:hypothetical protein
MAIPSKVTTNNQVQDGFRKLNETIDNIVTGLTYDNSTKNLTLSKLNGEIISTNINPYGYSDYQFYAAASGSASVIYNYGGGSGYFWKRDSLLHFGLGSNHSIYLPSSFTETKGYKLTIIRYSSDSGNVTVNVTPNGINSEPSIQLFQFNSPINTTLVYDGNGGYIYYSPTIDTSRTIQKTT